jgi:hypothetical protein
MSWKFCVLSSRILNIVELKLTLFLAFKVSCRLEGECNKHTKIEQGFPTVSLAELPNSAGKRMNILEDSQFRFDSFSLVPVE